MRQPAMTAMVRCTSPLFKSRRTIRANSGVQTEAPLAGLNIAIQPGIRAVFYDAFC
jgi:hypothetical protein